MLGHERVGLKEALLNPAALPVRSWDAAPGDVARRPDRNVLCRLTYPFSPDNVSTSLVFIICMIQFVCDYCANVKQPDEIWINGLAAENVGTQAARREVIVDPAWRRDRAILPFAVHFCSMECKENYLSELFSRPASLLEVESVGIEPASGRRVIRAKKKPAATKVPVGKTSKRARRSS